MSCYQTPALSRLKSATIEESSWHETSLLEDGGVHVVFLLSPAEYLSLIFCMLKLGVSVDTLSWISTLSFAMVQL